MKRIEIKEKIKNKVLKLELINDNIDDVYKSLPMIIKICNKKYVIDLIYNDEKIDIHYVTENNIVDKKLIDIIEVVHAINLKDIRKRFNYIYDTMCYKLDERRKRNYCQFENGICIKDRNKGSIHRNGCCECKGRGKCKYLVDGVCTLDLCFACKLFTCNTLKKMGLSQSINDFLLTKYFFTNKQKDILQFSYWTPKEVVMKRLLSSCRKL